MSFTMDLLAVYTGIFRDDLLKWIVRDDQPFTVVEVPEFRQVIKRLKPEASVPSADTVRRDIAKKFDMTRKLVRTNLQVC